MKKLVLVAALFMFVCGGTFLAQAKAPVEQPSKTTTLSLSLIHIWQCH